jgi:hypothetical protein
MRSAIWLVEARSPLRSQVVNGLEVIFNSVGEVISFHVFGIQPLIPQKLCCPLAPVFGQRQVTALLGNPSLTSERCKTSIGEIIISAYAHAGAPHGSPGELRASPWFSKCITSIVWANSTWRA